MAEDGVRLTTEGGLGIRGGRGGRGDPGLGAEAVKVAPAAASVAGRPKRGSWQMLPLSAVDLAPNDSGPRMRVS